jgi:hypothetical protein
MFTKVLPSIQFHRLLSKLGSINPLDPAWGGVLEISCVMCLYSSRTPSSVSSWNCGIVKDNTVYCYNLNPICNSITIRERLKQSLALFPYIYVWNFAGQSIRKTWISFTPKFFKNINGTVVK